MVTETTLVLHHKNIFLNCLWIKNSAWTDKLAPIAEYLLFIKLDNLTTKKTSEPRRKKAEEKGIVGIKQKKLKKMINDDGKVEN